MPECSDPSNLPVKIELDGTPALAILGSASSQLGAAAFGIDNGSTARIVGTRNPNPDECDLFFACGADDHKDAVQWQGTGSTTLTEYNPSPANLRHEAHDVNDQGQIAGTGFEDIDPSNSLNCRRDSLFWAGSTAAPVRLVPDVAADGAFARAIRNQLGSGEVQVVGQNTTDERALLWIRTGTTWTTYKLIDRLLQVNGWSSLRDATDINECGWIVGVWFPRRLIAGLSAGSHRASLFRRSQRRLQGERLRPGSPAWR